MNKKVEKVNSFNVVSEEGVVDMVEVFREHTNVAGKWVRGDIQMCLRSTGTHINRLKKGKYQEANSPKMFFSHSRNAL